MIHLVVAVCSEVVSDSGSYVVAYSLGEGVYVSCVCLGAQVSYIVCLCMLSSLEDSKFEGDLCGSGAFPADRWSFTETGHTWSQ